jgi:hypothetical protein
MARNLVGRLLASIVVTGGSVASTPTPAGASASSVSPSPIAAPGDATQTPSSAPPKVRLWIAGKSVSNRSLRTLS